MSSKPPLLTARDFSLSFGGKPLFEGLSFSIHQGEKICLVGRNGTGKSTLLKILAGFIEIDAGDFFIQPGTKIAYLPQDVILPPHMTALDYLISFNVDPHVAANYLDKLGMRPDILMQDLSGGEQRRIALASALSKEPDILLLDEPTNHLDIPAIEWLEDYMRNFKGAVVVISHDRSFLSKISNRTLWLDRGILYQNKKGYSDFERWTDEIFAEETRQMDKLKSKLRLEQEWLLYGVTARRKRNQGRLRKLHTMREQRRQREQNKHGQLKLGKGDGELSSKLIVEAKEISKKYGEKNLINNFSTRILRGDRIGVIGANGTGKTTLLKILVGDTQPDSGTVKKGKKIDLVYFDQMRDSLNLSKSLWENLCPTGGDQVIVRGEPRHVMAYLKDFLFDDKQVRGVASILSGGEKNRLALAKALAQPSNVLVLDEPTNDLDMDTLDLLIEMLGDYEGTLILVSHDRDFLNKTVTSVISVEGDGIIEEYVGGYDDYLSQRTVNTGKNVSKTIKKDVPVKSVDSSVESPVPVLKEGKKRLSYNQQRMLDLLPGKINDLENEINQIEEKLADPNFYAHHPQEFKALTERLGLAKKELAESEETWLELSILET